MILKRHAVLFFDFQVKFFLIHSICSFVQYTPSFIHSLTTVFREFLLLSPIQPSIHLPRNVLVFTQDEIQVVKILTSMKLCLLRIECAQQCPGYSLLSYFTKGNLPASPGHLLKVLPPLGIRNLRRTFNVGNEGTLCLSSVLRTQAYAFFWPIHRKKGCPAG